MRACFHVSALLLAALLLPALAEFARAEDAPANVSATTATASYNHCAIYNVSACPGVNVTAKAITATERNAASKPVWSAQAGKGSAAFAIDLNNTCRWVDDTNGNTTDVFVPFKTDQEWAAFVTAAGTSESAPSKYVALVHCARPGMVGIPANDPAGGDKNYLCYAQNGGLLTTTQAYSVIPYGRENEQRAAYPANMSFSCYTATGEGPWTKTVTLAELQGYSADRSGGSSSSRANSDWGVVSVAYQVQQIAGACGTADSQSVASQPSGAELCNAGVPTAVSGSGPWTWTCQGYNGGADSATCQANYAGLVCPMVVASGNALRDNSLTLTFTGVTGTVAVPATSWSGYSSTGFAAASYFDGKCSITRQAGATGNTLVVNVDGTTKTITGFGLAYMSDPVFVDFVQCVATQYAKQNLSGYANTPPCPVNGNAFSPIKVSLADGDAKLNSATPTDFDLTLKDGRTLEGHVKGGLNPDEGWLMVRRSADPLVFEDGALNANDWFGDRDHRSLNGYTDLAETFKDFVVKDSYGQSYIPLHVLTAKEKAAKAAMSKGDGAITDPSFDLRIVDASNNESFASDYFERIYVDYRNVVEGDGPDGKGGDNIILERGGVRTLKGENHSAVDQWFVLDVPADYGPVDHPTQSKVLPAQEN